MRPTLPKYEVTAIIVIDNSISNYSIIVEF